MRSLTYRTLPHHHRHSPVDTISPPPPQATFMLLAENKIASDQGVAPQALELLAAQGVPGVKKLAVQADSRVLPSRTSGTDTLDSAK